MDNDVVVRVEGVSKRHCRSLKRSLWYGVRDIVAEAFPVAAPGQAALRPGEFWAVRDVSLQLRHGECLGLIGPNGAGKSTLLKMLGGLMKPDAGMIRIRGRVGALIQLGAGFHPSLTGRENIYINGSILGMTRREIDRRFDEIVAFSGLEDALDTPVRFYSSGMYVRLGFSVAAHLEPDVLLVDEVLAVGDLQFVGRCLNRISLLVRQGTAIIFVSHAMHTVQRLCSQGMVLNHGVCTSMLSAPEAVMRYREMMAVSEPGQATTPQSSSEVLMTRLEILNEAGDLVPPDAVPSHIPLQLRVHYRSLIPAPEPHLIFELRIFAAEVLVATVNTKHDGIKIKCLFDEGVVAVGASLPLAPGVYRVEAGFRTSDGVGLLGWSTELGPVTIRGRGYVEGLVTLEHTFDHFQSTVPA